MVLAMVSGEAAGSTAEVFAGKRSVVGPGVVAVVMLPKGITLHLLVAGPLLLAALWLPVPLYITSLAVFGLPHVIWEMGFLRSRYAGRWPWSWWLALWLVLLVQACVRSAVWLDTTSGAVGQIVDLLSLLVLGLIVVAAPRGTGWGGRVAGLAVAGGAWLLLEHGGVLEALLVLAVLHNFTPLAMVWDMARDAPRGRRTHTLAWTITGLFLLPVLLASSGWSSALVPALMAEHAPLLQAQWPLQWGGLHQQAMLSAIVLAQCLHYYSMIVMLPCEHRLRSGRSVLPRWARLATWTAVALLLSYYAVDYRGARSLYSVAAGIHAWLEWPVLLMAWLSVQRGVLPETPVRH